MITLGTSKSASRWRTLALAGCLLIPGPLLAQDAAVHAAETATGDMAQLMDEGKGLYNTHCAACHQPTGQGLAGAFPPLAKSDYLMKDRSRALETVIEGRSGEIKVNGQIYNAVMPGMGHLSDAEIAAILTYATNSWGNEASAFSVAEVVQSPQRHRTRGSRGRRAAPGRERRRDALCRGRRLRSRRSRPKPCRVRTDPR